MIALFPTLAASLFLLAPQTPSPEETAASERLKSALAATGLTFATSTSGLSYTVVFDNADKRKQTVYVAVKPGRSGSIYSHILYTTVWMGTSAPDEALMRNVLGRSKKLGAYYLFKDSKGTWAIRFGAHFDATDLKPTSASGDAPATTLKDMLYFVNQVGEETDKELNGTKDNR